MTFQVAIALSALFLSSAFCALHIDFTDESTDALLGEIPHVVSLQSNNKHFCSGSLVDESWILTSAECVSNLKKEDIQVVAGVIKFDEQGQRETVKQIVTHENYKPPFENNIALVQLNNPFQLDENVRPIYVKSKETPVGTQVIAAGWNHTLSDDTLQKIYIKILSDESCNYGVHPKETVCAEEQSHFEFCLNDNGGPLYDFTSSTLIGLASSASSCGFGHPHMYTDVTPHLEWIQKNSEDKVVAVQGLKNKLLASEDLMDPDVLNEDWVLYDIERYEPTNKVDEKEKDDFTIKLVRTEITV